MKTKTATKAPGERVIRALLEKHACPVPYHEVRTRFLGNIATPDVAASPMQIIKGLWGGELPVFDSLDGLNEFLDTLAQGLWNDLTRHQKRSQPFRMSRVTMDSSVENLGEIGRVRVQELDGFIEGLFNGQDIMDLPERAHQSVGRIAELRAMMAGIAADLASRNPEPTDPEELELTFKELRELSRIMEGEIHEAVLSCARARRQMLVSIATEQPMAH